jgi:hypothetical protein
LREAVLSKAFNYLVLDPIEKRAPGLVPLRVAQLLHERTGGRSDLHFRRILRPLKPKVTLPASAHMTDAQIDSSVEKLLELGWNILPWRLGADDIAEITDFAFSTGAYAKDLGERIIIDRNDIPRAHGRYMWRMSDIIRVPAVQRLLADGAMHRIAQDYIGCRPLITGIELWLDPVIEGTYRAHVYHYDNDGPAFLKFFVYLHDVDVETGAHTYIERTQGRGKPEQFRLSKRYERNDLLNYYGEQSEQVFAAPAGTILAEDTAGFHKGTTLRRGYRLLLQLQYAMLDIPHEEEIQSSITRVKVEGLHPNIRKIASKLVC